MTAKRLPAGFVCHAGNKEHLQIRDAFTLRRQKYRCTKYLSLQSHPLQLREKSVSPQNVSAEPVLKVFCLKLIACAQKVLLNVNHLTSNCVAACVFVLKNKCCCVLNVAQELNTDAAQGRLKTTALARIQKKTSRSLSERAEHLRLVFFQSRRAGRRVLHSFGTNLSIDSDRIDKKFCQAKRDGCGGGSFAE